MFEDYESAFLDLRPGKYKGGDRVRLKDGRLVSIIGVESTTQSYLAIDPSGKSISLKNDQIQHKINLEREKSPEEIENQEKKREEDMSLSDAPLGTEATADVPAPIQPGQSEESGEQS